MRAKLKEIKAELRRRMHQPIPEQGKWLRQVVTGFFAYHAVPTNGRALCAFRYHITDLWRRTLRQRSQQDHTTWERITQLVDDFLPKPRVLHPWPGARLPTWALAGSVAAGLLAKSAQRPLRLRRRPTSGHYTRSESCRCLFEHDPPGQARGHAFRKTGFHPSGQSPRASFSGSCSSGGLSVAGLRSAGWRN